MIRLDMGRWLRAGAIALALSVLTASVVLAANWRTTGTLQGHNIEGYSTVSYPPGGSHQGISASTASAAVGEIWALSNGQQICDGIIYSAWNSGWRGNFNSTYADAGGSAGSICTGTQHHYYRNYGSHEWWVGTDGRTGTSCAGLTTSACY